LILKEISIFDSIPLHTLLCTTVLKLVVLMTKMGSRRLAKKADVKLPGQGKMLRHQDPATARRPPFEAPARQPALSGGTRKQLTKGNLLKGIGHPPRVGAAVPESL
jgi:hypothetical protein